MTTRSIVTSQPDVACDVCARRLLRGEQPDVFVTAGRRMTVCELCAPRAAFEGWLRESEAEGLTLPEARSRRGRSLIDRLRQVARPPGQGGPAEAAGLEAGAAGPFDLLADAIPAENGDGEASGEAALPVPSAPPYQLEALAVFNDSEFPRRVAGVARSLGPPLVSVRNAEHLDSVVGIVVAWELCWYRYEVDLSIEEPVAQVLAQGTELAELEREERAGNARALESGQLALAGG